jgi:hypothetical protein
VSTNQASGVIKLFDSDDKCPFLTDYYDWDSKTDPDITIVKSISSTTDFTITVQTLKKKSYTIQFFADNGFLDTSTFVNIDVICNGLEIPTFDMTCTLHQDTQTIDIATG